MKTSSFNWSDGTEVIADHVFWRFERHPDEWHIGYHPAGYTGPVWIRIVPDAAAPSTAYVITILWASTASASNAIVTFGQGPPPDPAAVNIDEGWVRVAGAPIVS